MKFTDPKHPDEAGFDLTPMVDIVLLLIIFFAFTAQFAKSLATPLDLPRESGEKSPESAPESVVIDLTREGRYIVMGRDIEIDWIVQTLATDARRVGGPDKLEVIIRADRACAAVHLNALAGALSRVGIRAWKLSTEEGVAK